MDPHRGLGRVIRRFLPGLLAHTHSSHGCGGGGSAAVARPPCLRRGMEATPPQSAEARSL